MQILLAILIILIVIIVLFILTDLKVYVEFDNVSSCNKLKLKVYAFSILPVCILKREIKSEEKKQSIKEKIELVYNYLVKSKADPIEFARKEVDKSDKIPKVIKSFAFNKIYLENANLNLCLDFNNAALSAIGSGAINAVISMVLTKYRDNIAGPVKYKIFPGYSGNGVKLEVSAKARIKAKYVVKLLIAYIKEGGK